MKESNLTFEKVGDINSTYPYLCIYDRNDQINPFMEVAITDNKELQYTIYAGCRNVTLTPQDLEYIETKAQIFFLQMLSEENYISAT